MRPRLVLLMCIALTGTFALAQQRLYRWVDENGVVHYGDRIPPEYADRDREVLNDHGVAVGFEGGRLSEEERASREQERRAQEQAQEAKAEIARRDRMLLETYLTVKDIEDLRDRRLELLESQIRVTELYLEDLRKQLAALEAEAARYRPYSEREDAPQVPAEVDRDLRRTRSLIASYQDSVARTREDQLQLRAQFESDIERFKELKGLTDSG